MRRDTGKTLISVHVPKTGGTTFHAIPARHFGDRLFLDYVDRPLTQGSLLRNLSALKSMFFVQHRCRKYDCIHGHFLPVKYLGCRNKSLAIWLRDPAERLVSRYYHWARNKRPDRQFRKYIRNEHVTLKDFCRIPHYQNLYAKYLWGVSLENFDFVGITEDYASSLEIFGRMYGIDIPSVGVHNSNPAKASENYAIGDDLRRMVFQKNRKDYDIYHRALRINSHLRSKYLR